MRYCTALRAIEAGYLRAIKNPHAAGFRGMNTYPITGSYFSFSVVALVPVSVIARALSGVPVLL